VDRQFESWPELVDPIGHWWWGCTQQRWRKGLLEMTTKTGGHPCPPQKDNLKEPGEREFMSNRQ